MNGGDCRDALPTAQRILELVRETTVEREIRDERERNQQSRYSARVWRAVMLSPRVGTCGALLRGESVPIERLDPSWVKRFGKRET
jgi:hypothetical protein